MFALLHFYACTQARARKNEQRNLGVRLLRVYAELGQLSWPVRSHPQAQPTAAEQCRQASLAKSLSVARG